MKKKHLSQIKELLSKIENVSGFSEELRDELKGGKPTGRKAVRVYVRKKLRPEQLAAEQILPETIKLDSEEIPIDVIELDAVAYSFVDPTKKYRPIFGGISVGEQRITAGTLSYFVRDSQGRIYILSNYHVLNGGYDQKGDLELQPGPYDGGQVSTDVVATLTAWVPIVWDGSSPPLPPPSNCPVAKIMTVTYNVLASLFRRKTRLLAVVPQDVGQNEVDAAIALVQDGIQYAFKINGIQGPVGIDVAKVGDLVVKSGRTTGVTYGKVFDDAATIQVNYGDGRTATFVHQVVIENDAGSNFSAGGDSGSLILDQTSLKAKALLFAGGSGYTIANQIKVVLEQLSQALGDTVTLVTA